MSEEKKTKLGKILIKQKLVKEEDLEDALAEQGQVKERLASKVLKKGLANKESLIKALSEQHGIPGIDLDFVEIDLNYLEIIPYDIAKKNLILPISVSSDLIHLVMANPEDTRVIEEIEFVSGKKAFPHISLQSQISKTIDACYNALKKGEKTFRGSLSTSEKNSLIHSDFADKDKVTADPDSVECVIADETYFEDSDIGITIDLDVKDPPATKTANPPPPAPIISQKPIVSSKDSQSAMISDIPMDAGTKKILVVDDEDDIRLLISRVLEEKGYVVGVASRGFEAIRKIQNETPDILILDAMLPEVHGFDICKKIKGSNKYGHIPVIMISAIYRGWRYAQDLKESYGVDEFIEKPFKINVLLDKVEMWAKRSQMNFSASKENLAKKTEKILSDAIKAYQAGNIDDAIDLLKKGIKIDPLAFKLHYHIALLLGRKGLNYQAIRELENALEIEHDNFSALKNLAVLYQKAGFKFKSVETWERAISHCDDKTTVDGIKKHLMKLL